MKVILLEDIKGVGKKSDVINAKDGYARNFLLPKKLAMEATTENMRGLEKMKKELALKRQADIETARKVADDFKGKSVTIKIKAGQNGKLFGSVTNKEIAAAVKEQLKMDIDKRKIVLGDPIKTLGSLDVPIKIHPEVEGRLTVSIVAADA